MTAAAAADRLDAAVRLLLEGNSPHMVVADIAARYGCCKRTGRNVVAKAYQQIQKDVVDVGLDRKALTAQTVHCLQAGMAQALATNQIGSVIGTARELRELLGLGPQRLAALTRSLPPSARLMSFFWLLARLALQWSCCWLGQSSRE